MFLDASVVAAIALSEPEAPIILEKIDIADSVYVSAIVVFEAAMALARVKGLSPEHASELIDRIITELDARLVPIDGAMALEALKAASRFGKGRHKAALNLGDCFSYAAAYVLRVPLLYKGNDFSQTDLEKIGV
jgi:ribonuclease VapC